MKAPYLTHGKTLVCPICQDRFQLPSQPLPTWALTALINGFEGFHADCIDDAPVTIAENRP